MTDQTPHNPTTDRDSADRPEPRRASRNIPPLVWVVVAILVAWLAVALIQRNGADRTPQGGATPSAAEDASVMPAAPATGDAPATPAGVINGPNQPAPN
ncbi:hypothetical protein [Phenylobacterium sp.]|uniref:hypothetical protein n=1 Tax=Phenylobacterium sp. TaxID=1871053 RepID=UPI0039837651